MPGPAVRPGPGRDVSAFAVRGTLVTPEGERAGAVVIDGEHIARVAFEPLPAGLPPIVHQADRVAPGFIDLQVNGGFGVDVATDDGAIEALCAALPATGVTAFLPTVISAPLASYQRAAEALARAARAQARADSRSGRAGAAPLGLHLEGPFLSPARAGAHPPADIAAAEADPDLWGRLLDLDGVRLVTTAPERPGALARIAAARARGIAVSLGHTDATYDQLIAGIDAGAALVTHLYNAMSPFRHRHPGAAGAALTDDRVVVCLIADGAHCHPAAARLALRAAGPARVALVTDAMAAAGAGPGRYTLAGREVRVDDTTARLEDGTLAGSILTLDRAVRNAVAWAGATPAEALAMASAVPARALGLTDRGQLRAGARADLVLLDQGLEVVATYVGGREVFGRERPDRPATSRS